MASSPCSTIVIVVLSLIVAVKSQQTQSQSINTIVMNSKNAATFSSLWKKAGGLTFLNTDLSSGGIPFTVFVPTDSAFGKLSSDQLNYINTLSDTALINFLFYHTLPQITQALIPQRLGYKLSDLPNYGTQYGNLLNYRKYQSNFGPPAPGSGLSTECIFASPYNLVFVNNAQIVAADVIGVDGVVHYIDDVLFNQDSTVTTLSWLVVQVPPSVGVVQYTTGCPTDQCSPQFINFLKNTPSNPLTAATKAFGWLTNTLGNVRSAVTMFVPNSAAMDAIPADKLAALTSDLATLTKVVLAHVHSGRVLYLNPLMNATVSPIAAISVPLSCGPSDASVSDPSFAVWVQTCTVFYPGSKLDATQLRVQVGRTSARIVRANIPVQNGVVHIIDNLLGYVYLDCLALLANNANYSMFYSAVSADAYLKQFVSTGTVTVFPMTNAAFNAALNAVGGSFNSTMMRNVLMLHIVPNFVRSIASIGDSAQSDTNLYGTAVRYVRTVDATRVESGFGKGFVSGRIVMPDLACTNGVAHGVDAMFGVATITVQQFVESRADLSQTAARLVEAQQTFLANPNSSPYTLFAPNDLAWQYLSKTVPSIDQSVSLRINIMRRHVLVGRIQMTSISLATVFNTPYGQITITQVAPTWRIQYSRTVANVITNDYLCRNGLVQIIDTVLYAVEDNFMMGSSCVDPAHCTSAVLKSNLFVLFIVVLLRQIFVQR